MSEAELAEVVQVERVIVKRTARAKVSSMRGKRVLKISMRCYESIISHFE